MDEDLDPSVSAYPVITNRSILTIMVVLVVLGTGAGFLFAGPRFGIAVLLGGIVGLLNYYWLDRVTKAMFRGDGLNTGGVLAMKYVFRYVMIAAVLWLVYATDALPVAAVILGIGSFAAAVVIQGVRNIFVSST